MQHCPEYKAFYDKKFAEVRTHQHKRALALTSRKLIQYLVFRGVEALYGSLDCGVYGLKFFFKGADAVEGTANRNSQWLVKALVQPVGVLCGLLQQISGDTDLRPRHRPGLRQRHTC